MSSSWPMILINEFMVLREPNIEVYPDQQYHFAGVYCFGKGVFKSTTKSGAEFSYKRLSRLRRDDFVYPKLMAWEGAFAVVPPECDGLVVSTEFPVFEIDPKIVLPEFIELYFKRASVWPSIAGSSTGTNVRRRRLNPANFLQNRFPVPSIREQRRVVARIKEVTSRVDEANNLRQLALVQSESLLEASIISAFSDVEHFEKRQLSILASKIGSGCTPPGGRASYPAFGIPFIRSMNVRMRFFSWEGITFIDESTHERMAGTSVKPRDVFLNITGASIGRVACAPDDLVRANVNQHVAIIRPKDGLDPRYLMYWISHPTVQSCIADEQKGATRQGFTKRQIEELDTPLPSLARQRAVVSYLDGLQSKTDALIRYQTEAMEQAEALLPAVLEKAFKGEL